MGLYDEATLQSRLGLFNSTVIWADFQDFGTIPSEKD